MPSDEANGPREANVARVRSAILGYLDRHANAADTREGIIDWWLPIEQRALDRAVIEQALELLVAEGLLTGTRLVVFAGMVA